MRSMISLEGSHRWILGIFLKKKKTIHIIKYDVRRRKNITIIY